MDICIAQSKKTLGHYFLRLVEDDKVFSYEDELLPELINNLVSAKTHKQIVATLDNIGLLFNSSRTGKHNSVMTPLECINALNSDFVPVDASKLSEEMYLSYVSDKAIRANSGKESPAASFDAYSCCFVDRLKEIPEGYKVVVEPIQDWMTFRNMLSICASLLGRIERGDDENKILAHSGFFEPETNAFGFPVLAFRYKFQAATWLLNFTTHPLLSSKLETADLDYLNFLYSHGVETVMRKKSLIAPVVTRAFGEDADVFLVTHYLAKQKNIELRDLAKLLSEDDKYLYLCVKKEGSQLDIAKKIVLAIWRAHQNLNDRDGSVLGMVRDDTSLFDLHSSAPTYTCSSLMSKLMYALCFHSAFSQKLTICKHCGCGMLSPVKGRPKSYCSDSCRTQHA